MRLPHRSHHLGALTTTGSPSPTPGGSAAVTPGGSAAVTPGGSAAVPPGGGIDLDLPGALGRLRATRWPGRSDATGPPVLLLHGLGSDRRYWDRVAPQLRPLPVVALDARGHGGTPEPTGASGTATGRGESSLSGLAADVAVALDALGLSRVLAVGHSWGGAIALTLAAEHPERVLGVIALDGGFTLRRTAQEQEALAAELLPEDASTLRRAQLAALLDLEPAAVLSRIPVPCWLVACSPVPDPSSNAIPGARTEAHDREPGSVAIGGAGDERTRRKLAGLDRAGQLLARPRLMHWVGVDHDVPLRWPALVTGLIRAAADDVAGGGR